MDQLTVVHRHMDEGAIKALEGFTNEELEDKNIAYRKLCGLGFVYAAVTILRMDRVDYECFLINTCQSTEGPEDN
jgi:hypothetical protein